MKIVVSRDSEVLQEIDLSEEVKNTDASSRLSFFLGRSEHCHIILDDQKVSREHAEIIYQNGEWTLRQVSSFGQLTINGSSMNEKKLAPGDLLILGPFVVSFTPELKKEDQGKYEEVADETSFIKPEEEANVDLETKTIMEPKEQAQENTEQDENEAEAEAPQLSDELESDFVNGEGLDEQGPEDSELESQLDQEEGFTSDGSENVEFSAENEGTDFPEESDEVEDFEASHSSFPVDSEMMTEVDGDDGFDESTKVVQSFAKFQLELFGEYAPYDKFNLEQEEVLIGRDPEKCHIVLNDPEVSSTHASIKRNNITCTLEDLQSGNGTLLNGERINKTSLTNGDEFIIGSTTFTVRVVSDFLEQENERLMPVDENQSVEIEEVVEVGADFDDPSDDANVEGSNFGDDQTANLGGNQSLIQKFRSMPPKKQLLYGTVGILLFLLFFGEEDGAKKTASSEEDKKEKEEVVSEQATSDDEQRQLDPETLEIVEASYQLSNNYIQKGMYDEALQELDRNIFRYTPKYKNADQLREIAVAGIEKREEIERERRREIREAEKRKKVKDLVEKASDAVEERNVALAEDLFGKITTLDPENFEVSALKIELDAWKKEQERKEVERAQKEAERKRMVEALKPGKNLYLRKEWHKAIIRLEQFLEKDGMDDDLVTEATKMLEESRQNQESIVGPLLGKARSLREGQDLKGAYEHYAQVLEQQPTNVEAMNEMNEIRNTLRQRSQKVYREAIIAESLSLLKDAKEKYQEVQQISPTDSEYYKKATDKLKEYVE